MPVIKYSANSKKRYILLAGKVVFDMVEMALSSANCLHRLKWDHGMFDSLRHRSMLPGDAWRVCVPVYSPATSHCRPLPSIRHRAISPELYPNGWMNIPQTSTYFPDQRGHQTSIQSGTSGMPSINIFEPLTLLHQIFLNCRGLSSCRGSACLPTAFSATVNYCHHQGEW